MTNIHVWEFFGKDPVFGDSASDRVLHLRGVVPVFLHFWEKTAQDREASFNSVGEAQAAVDFSHRALPHHLRPRKGALIAIMKDVQHV